MRIAVIGAGIGGLATAVGLHRTGHDIVVYERAAALAPVGSGLSLFGNAFAALDYLGLGTDVRAISSADVVGFRAGQRRPDGQWLASTPVDALNALRVVHRAELHDVLRAALPRAAVKVATEVVATTPDGTVSLRDAERRDSPDRFDLVVAADGIRSRTRASWPRDPGVRYSGYSTWRGVTGTPVDLRREAGETWGSGLRFGLAPLMDGRVYWFGVATLPEGLTFSDELAELQQRFDRWHAPIAELIAATAPESISRHDIHDLAAPLPTFVRGKVVLLGDAAHAMTPDLGQGGGQALEDAATLVALLRREMSEAELTAALARYDVVRRHRVQPMARRARTLGQLGQLHGAIRTRWRNLVIRAIPESVMRRQLAALQHWEPPTN